MKTKYVPMPNKSKKAMQKRLNEMYANEEAKQMWGKIERIYREFVETSPHIGGKKNPMCGSFYGAIACFAWYEAFERKLSLEEMDQILRDNMVGDVSGMKKVMERVDLNNPILQKLVNKCMESTAKNLNARKADGSWNNTWGMRVNPLNRKEGISMHLDGCPIVDFAKKHGYMDLMPVFCGSDYVMIEEGMGKKLIREHTVADGDGECDYWIVNR